MGIEETGPEEEVLTVPLILFHQRVRPLGNPRIVMIFFRNWPFPILSAGIPCRRCEIVAPIRAALLLHPDGVVLSDVRLIGVIAGEFNMLKPIKRFIKVPPKIQVLQNRVGFKRRELVCAVQRLKMCLADEGGAVTCRYEIFTDGMLLFREFRAEGPGTVLTRIFAGDDRGARRCACRIRTIRAMEKRALLCQSIQGRCLNLRVETP